MFFILKCKKVVFFFNFCFNININSKIKKKNLKLEQKSNIQSLL